MLNVKRLVIAIALISLSFSSGLGGYYLNQAINASAGTEESVEHFREEIRSRMNAQLAEIKNTDRDIEIYKNALKEAQREASDCRYVRTYTSKLYRFQISFPTDDWCSPSPYNKEPSFHAESSCTDNPPLGRSCKGLRIIDQSKYSTDTIDSTLEKIKKDNRTPVILKNFIDGAVTIKAQAPDLWGEQNYEYNIFFEDSQRQFYVSTSNKFLEPVIKTLVPLEDENPLSNIHFSNFEKWKTYENREMGIEMKYPPELFISTSDEMIIFSPFNPNDPIKKQEGSVLADFKLSLKVESIEDVIKDRKSAELEELKQISLVVNKIKSQRLSYRDAFAGGMFFETYIPKGEQTLSFWHSDTSATKPIYEKMLQTVFFN